MLDRVGRHGSPEGSDIALQADTKAERRCGESRHAVLILYLRCRSRDPRTARLRTVLSFSDNIIRWTVILASPSVK